MLFSYIIIQSTGEGRGGGIVVGGGKLMYVLSEYQKKHNTLYVLKGDGFQCFQPCRK